MIRSITRPGAVSAHRGARRPLWPFALNRSHPLSAGMLVWWPMHPAAPNAELAKSRPTTITSGWTDFSGADIELEACAYNNTSSGRYLESPYAADMNLTTTNEWTVAIWIRPNTASGAHYLADRQGAGAATTAFDFYINGSQVFVEFASGASYNPLNTSAGTISANTLYHLVARHSATQQSIWVNGASAASRTGSYSSNAATTNFRGLAYIASGGFCFAGVAADLIYWNRSLTDQEVVSLYNPQTRWSHYRPLRQRVMLDPTVVASGYVERGGLFMPMTGF